MYFVRAFYNRTQRQSVQVHFDDVPLVEAKYLCLCLG